MRGENTTGSDAVLGIIPVRMASVRFPGKPLALARGIPMVIRVYEQSRKVLPEIIIATGDAEIGLIAEKYGFPWILTELPHTSGTSRCLEAATNYCKATGKSFKAVMNIQGDEPSIRPDMITALALEISQPDVQITTLVSRETDEAGYMNPNRVKVATNCKHDALLFSRAPIPFHPPGSKIRPNWLSHIGIYAYKTEILKQICECKPSPLEIAESLEQLRWLENGFLIRCLETDYIGFGIDTPQDLIKYNLSNPG